MPTDPHRTHNPALYHRLSVPRPRAEVEASIRAFDTDVQAARERHGIAELLIVYGAMVAPEEGEAGRAELVVAIATAGSSARVPLLALHAARVGREEHLAMYDRAVAGGEGEEEQ